MRDNRNPLCLKSNTQLGAILETSTTSMSFENVVSDVWSSIGSLLATCYGSDLNSVVEALESILVVDDILSYAPFLSQGGHPDTHMDTHANNKDKYAFIVRRIALLRHAVLREGSCVFTSNTIDDADLDVSDVHTYLKRANRFAAANDVFSNDTSLHTNMRTDTSTNTYALLTTKTSTSTGKKRRRNSTGSLEHILQTMCESSSHLNRGAVAPLPALYDLDPVLTTPLSHTPVRSEISI